MDHNPRDLARELAIVTLIADIAKDQRDYLRGEMLGTLADLGADSTSADVDGERIAKVSIISPKASATVTNEAAFTTWVQERRPEEIVESVRESYKKYLVDHCSEGPDGQAVDLNGEIIEGMAYRVREPYVSTRFEKTGRNTLSAALKAGTMAYTLWSPKQLEAGEQQ